MLFRSPLERVIAESLRLLRNGGRGLFITHARSGVTVSQARVELVDIDELQGEIRIFPAALEALPLLFAAERSSRRVPFKQLADARHAHEAFHERLARVGDNWQKRAALAVFRDTGTILQVVRNPGWLLPYIAVSLGALGMLVHFGLHLTGFLRRRVA